MAISIEQWHEMLGREQKPKRARGVPREHILQTRCVAWFRAQFPSYAHLLWATPNGVFCSRSQAEKLKEEGMVAGVPDLFLAVPSGGHHGFFIEMKAGKTNNLTKEQKQMLTELSVQGYKCECVRYEEQFHKTIKEYLSC